MSESTPSQRSIEIAAQCWCTPETGGIEMDARLATAFAVALDRELSKFQEWEISTHHAIVLKEDRTDSKLLTVGSPIYLKDTP